MLSIFLLIPLSLMLFVVAIWAVRYAVKSNQFEDLDNASQRIILDDRQERRQTIQDHDPNHTPPQTSKPLSPNTSQSTSKNTLADIATNTQTTNISEVNNTNSAIDGDDHTSKKLTDK